MYEASLTEVLKVVLIVLLIYFGLKLIIRWLGPILLRWVLKKIGKKFEQKFSLAMSIVGHWQKKRSYECLKKFEQKFSLAMSMVGYWQNKSTYKCNKKLKQKFSLAMSIQSGK